MVGAIGADSLSDWSLSHLLDEVWLRARRVLIRRLDLAGYWIGKAEYQDFLDGQRAIGAHLRDEWLAEALGSADSLCLQSERAFRAANVRVRSRIPLIMAFGHGLGDGLARLIADDPLPRTAGLCALFNLGISFFDAVVDQPAALRSALAQHFDGHVLQNLAAEPDAARRHGEVFGQVEDDEIRILLKIVAAFFRELHSLYAAAGSQPSPRMAALLEQAYLAELSSTQDGGAPRASDPTRTAELKSTLPFVIIGQIALAGVPCAPASAAAGVDRLAAELGGVFWLVDDLADLATDARSGSLNAVLLRAGLSPELSRDSTALRRGMGDLLDGLVIEDTAADVVTRLASVDRVLASFARDESAGRLRQIVRCYVRSWIT